MSAPRSHAAIRFEPDGYDIGGDFIMGRQSAGLGLLRAAVAARGDEPVRGYGPHPASAAPFERLVTRIDPQARTEWIRSSQPDRLNAVGVCYLPGPGLTDEARLRLRVGPARHSLCGVTHTTAGVVAMAAIKGLLSEYVMPWDALICTSQAVAKTVRCVHEAEAEALRWRFGADIRITAPQLPVIPLGVHCDDFDFSAAQRAHARAALGLLEDDIMVLYVGRLSVVQKAHPFQMYRALSAAADRAGRSLVLVQCGWAHDDQTRDAFQDGAAAFAPNIRARLVDGRDAALRDQCWAGADIFMSLSDNIQETFGLTPLEAMAAGLPVIVSDWNGYRETVQHEVHGFRAATWAPPEGYGRGPAAAFESGAIDYTRYCWEAAAVTSLDAAQLTDGLVRLIESPDLRRRMGAAGRATARQDFDWTVVFARYQELWAELNARRRSVEGDPDTLAWLMRAPPCAPERQDPFAVFGHYPTRVIGPDTRVTAAPGFSETGFAAINRHPLFVADRLPADTVIAIANALEGYPSTIAALAVKIGLPPARTLLIVAALAKMQIVRID